MKAVSFRAVAGAQDRARQLYAVTRTAIPENRVTLFIEDAMKETAHALLMSREMIDVSKAAEQLTIFIIVSEAE